MLEKQHVRLAGLKSASTASPDLWIRFVLVTCYWFLAGMCQARRTPGGIVHVALGTLKLKETVPHVPLDERTARGSHPQRNECQRKPSSSMQASSALPLCHPAFSVPLERGLACEGGSS